MRYVDLMSGQKPHLLVSITNNLGKRTVLHYKSSTEFYLDDREAGTPWITKLPFPVQVLEKSETFDGVTGAKLVTHYRYHHGYFDGEEREFRGFGMIEQWDAESFAEFRTHGSVNGLADQHLYVPPVHTKTWYHTGAYPDRTTVSRHFAHECYQADVAVPAF